jgi:type IV secretory pathway VirB2 component (pilin)
MNLFSKQISTIFFSLFFFLLSGEAWAGIVTSNISAMLTCSTSIAPCDGSVSGFCATANQVENFTDTNGNIYGTYTVAGGVTGADTNLCKAACVAACVLYKASGVGEYAIASTSSNTFSKSICNAFRIVTGSAGKTFAAFAIIATGIGFFSGKVSWGLMIGVAAGIATMFGAPSIVAAISGTTVNTQCTLAAGAYTP